MFDVLPDRIPWYVVGPGLGLLIILLYSVANQPLGASGAYGQTMGLVRGRTDVAVWRVWYFAGMFLGGLLVTQVLREGAEVRSGYDAMRAVWSLPAVVVAVAAGATLLGYGAGVGGGCTSGHGLCGTSQRSLASFANTVTFIGTAVVITFVLRVLTGGDL